ncbi:MAG: HAD family hydrolase [Verrucomicrobiia bacterium]
MSNKQIINAQDLAKLRGANGAVFCDVDGTLSRTNIVEPLIWIKRRILRFPINYFWLTSLLFLCPYWILLDRFSRSVSNISIYKQYKNLPVHKIEELTPVYYQQVFKKRIFKEALEELQIFRENDFRIVLVSGGIGLFLQPLAKELDADCIAISLKKVNGLFTGEIDGEPLTGRVKADLLKQYAAKNKIDLNISYALGDAIGDLEMLECVGNPVVVNPDSRLLKHALSKGWKIVYWKV